MAKSKQEGPALFDLLGSGKEEINAQFRPRDVQPAARPAQRPQHPAPEQPIVPTRPKRPKAATGEAGHRLVELDDECVRFSFTSTTAAVTVFAVLLVMLTIYETGRVRGRDAGYRTGYRAGRASFEADAASEIEAARNQPATPHLVEDLLAAAEHPAAGGSDTSGDAAAPQWVEGHTYIVAQEFSPRARDDAIAAQTYLRSQGIDTALITLDNGWFQLLTTQGYDRSDPVQRDLLDELLAREHRAGAAYYASGGGYKLEGYPKTLRNQSW